MKTQAFCAALMVFGSVGGSAHADHLDHVNFRDRNVNTEFFICVTEGDRNNRLVYSREDRNFCNHELEGHIQLLGSVEAGQSLGRSKILCYQRNRRCMAPEEQANGY